MRPFTLVRHSMQELRHSMQKRDARRRDAAAAMHNFEEIHL